MRLIVDYAQFFPLFNFGTKSRLKFACFFFFRIDFLRWIFGGEFSLNQSYPSTSSTVQFFAHTYLSEWMNANTWYDFSVKKKTKQNTTDRCRLSSLNWVNSSFGNSLLVDFHLSRFYTDLNVKWNELVHYYYSIESIKFI